MQYENAFTYLCSIGKYSPPTWTGNYDRKSQSEHRPTRYDNTPIKEERADYSVVLVWLSKYWTIRKKIPFVHVWTNDWNILLCTVILYINYFNKKYIAYWQSRIHLSLFSPRVHYNIMTCVLSLFIFLNVAKLWGSCSAILPMTRPFTAAAAAAVWVGQVFVVQRRKLCIWKPFGFCGDADTAEAMLRRILQMVRLLSEKGKRCRLFLLNQVDFLGRHRPILVCTRSRDARFLTRSGAGGRAVSF